MRREPGDWNVPKVKRRGPKGKLLATGGPFRFLRNPIYMGLNLLGLGTAIWAPTPTLWLALGLTLVGSDLRGREEEKLLAGAFGEEYLRYRNRTKRFVPGVY
jgi:protein-S-isoprenylcysteine O-methyltransferase Ste14